MTRPTNEKRRPGALGGLAGSALAALAVLAAGTASGTAAPAKAPQNTAKPTITGTAQEGQTLTAQHGDWSGDPTDYSYQWRRCDRSGGNCNNIQKAIDTIYTAGSNDVGHTLRVLVTAFNNDGAGTATSNPTDVATAAPPQAPTTSSQPRITGTPKQGEVLTAQPNAWTGTKPIQITYRWRRCDDKGGDCRDTGVTTQTYKLADADVDHTLRVVVIAANSAGSGASISDPSALIQSSGPAQPPPPPPPNGGCTSVSNVSLPEQLVVDRIRYTPSAILSRNEPLIARFHVTTTKNRCISGALVYAVGVPFDRLSKEPEAQTDGSGFATISFNILPTFELKPGNLVVIFVRARKPGDSMLAGVSARRLVSVRVGS